MTSAGRKIKNKNEILALLEVFHLPTKVSIIHSPGHQKGDTPVLKGNQLVDQVAREVANTDGTVSALAVQEPPPEKTPAFTYTSDDLKKMAKLDKDFNPISGVWKTKVGKTIIPAKEARSVLLQMHQWTHLGARKFHYVKIQLSHPGTSYHG